MTLDEAEIVKQKLEDIINRQVKEGLKEIEVFIAPSLSHDFEAFRKLWRNTTYVVALATYGHADMSVYVCDENYVSSADDFETIEEFSARTGITI